MLVVENGIFLKKKLVLIYRVQKVMEMLLKLIKFGIQFPVGENITVFVGPKIENYYMHGTTSFNL